MAAALLGFLRSLLAEVLTNVVRTVIDLMTGPKVEKVVDVQGKLTQFESASDDDLVAAGRASGPGVLHEGDDHLHGTGGG